MLLSIKFLSSIPIFILTFFIYRRSNYFWLNNITAKLKRFMIKND